MDVFMKQICYLVFVSIFILIAPLKKQNMDLADTSVGSGRFN